jgi:hypothetical protein
VFNPVSFLKLSGTKAYGESLAEIVFDSSSMGTVSRLEELLMLAVCLAAPLRLELYEADLRVSMGLTDCGLGFGQSK